MRPCVPKTVSPALAFSFCCSELALYSQGLGTDSPLFRLLWHWVEENFLLLTVMPTTVLDMLLQGLTSWKEKG